MELEDLSVEELKGIILDYLRIHENVYEGYCNYSRLLDVITPKDNVKLIKKIAKAIKELKKENKIECHPVVLSDFRIKKLIDQSVVAPTEEELENKRVKPSHGFIIGWNVSECRFGLMKDKTDLLKHRLIREETGDLEKQRNTLELQLEDWLDSFEAMLDNLNGLLETRKALQKTLDDVNEELYWRQNFN